MINTALIDKETRKVGEISWLPYLYRFSDFCLVKVPRKLPIPDFAGAMGFKVSGELALPQHFSQSLYVFANLE